MEIERAFGSTGPGQDSVESRSVIAVKLDQIKHGLDQTLPGCESFGIRRRRHNYIIDQSIYFYVTNNGQAAATLIPPSASPFERLLQAGSIRPAIESPVDFRLVERVSSDMTTADILADLRGDR
ncbi:hypothetical protein GCM10010052_14440 [Paenarthrobacter histidinolovorans]|nr:hypothetical protein GCM10010052_14440 [Paenarthrobacter histidinolovorans]